jgi:hypothetical protein
VKNTNFNEITYFITKFYVEAILTLLFLLSWATERIQERTPWVLNTTNCRGPSDSNPPSHAADTRPGVLLSCPKFISTVFSLHSVSHSDTIQYNSDNINVIESLLIFLLYIFTRKNMQIATLTMKTGQRFWTRYPTHNTELFEQAVTESFHILFNSFLTFISFFHSHEKAL